MIVLPWPDSRLSPNARQHWARRAKVAKAYRAVCGWEAKAQGLGRMRGPINATIVFRPPDARRRDLDNMLAALKAGIDGLADVTGVDDYLWSFAISRGDPVKGGRVEVTLSNNQPPDGILT